MTGKKFAGLVVALFFRFVGFQDRGDPAASAIRLEASAESFHLQMVFLGREHSRYDRGFCIRTYELGHEFSCQPAVQLRIDTNHAGTAAVRSISRDANYPDVVRL